MLSAEKDTDDCSKIKLKEPKSEANIAHTHGNDSDLLGIHFLSPLLVVVQMNLSEIFIWVLPITFVPNGSDLLVLKN